MLSKYGLASAVSAGNYNIASDPLYFVRSGDIALTSINSSTLLGLNTVGYNWSSRSSTYSTSAYDIMIESIVSVSTHGPDDRYYAFPLRCLSTVLGM